MIKKFQLSKDGGFYEDYFYYFEPSFGNVKLSNKFQFFNLPRQDITEAKQIV